MKKMKAFLKKFANSGFEQPVYKEYNQELMQQNNRMVLNTSFIGSIMMLFLSVAAIFVASVSRVLPLYFATALGFAIVYVVASKIGRKSGVITLVCNYAMLTIAFFFAIGLDIIQMNPTATTICVLLVAMPLLVVDKPYREGTYFLLISVLFIYETVYIKHSYKASVDVLNGVSFLIVGLFLGYKHNQMQLNNIMNQKLLEKQRDMDMLTSLYNKAAIENRAVNFLNKEDVKASIMIIDMDNFKYVNDTYGHKVGDELLINISKVLQSLFKENSFVSRFGGDEFIIFFPNIDKKELLINKADAIIKEIEHIRIDENPDYRAHICIGIAIYPYDGNNYEELFRNADSAMYEVKRNGKNGYAFYDANIKKKILLVDDVEVNRAMLKANLEPEFKIIEANDGNNALDILKDNKDISIVITDIQMPNMDGIQLIKAIRANRNYDRIAIIANTQYGDLKQEEEIYNLGVDDFVYRPSSPRTIKIRINNLLKTIR